MKDDNADNAMFAKLLLVRDVDKERLLCTILFILMVGIIMFLKVVLYE